MINNNKSNLKNMSEFSCFNQPFTFRRCLLQNKLTRYYFILSSYRKVKGQKGLSIYLAVMIMSIILAMVLGITTILTKQIKTIKGIENSVIAFYGADTGIERLLKERKEFVSGEMTIGMGKNVTYEVWRIKAGLEGCPSPVLRFCIKSEGTYEQTKRAIKITM